MSTTVTYKGSTLTTVNNATKTLKTAGKYMEGDVVLTDTTVDLSSDTVTPDTLMQGYTAHDKSGALITGTMSGGNYQEKTVTPSKTTQVVLPDSGTSTTMIAAGTTGIRTFRTLSMIEPCVPFYVTGSLTVSTSSNSSEVTLDGVAILVDSASGSPPNTAVSRIPFTQTSNLIQNVYMISDHIYFNPTGDISSTTEMFTQDVVFSDTGIYTQIYDWNPSSSSSSVSETIPMSDVPIGTTCAVVGGLFFNRVSDSYVLVNESFVWDGSTKSFTVGLFTIEVSQTLLTITGTSTVFGRLKIHTVEDIETYDALSKVTVEPIPSEYIIPTGELGITENGTGIDVTSYASVDVTVEDNTFVVTLSYNESTQMWEPDKTFAEIKTAYEAGKTIAVEATPKENEEMPAVMGEWAPPNGGMFAYETNETHLSSVGIFDGFIRNAYFLTSNGTVNPTTNVLWLTEDATATPSDVLSGKVFYNVNGQQTGTAITPTPSLQSKLVTPTESAQMIVPDSGYDGLNEVDVAAIPSTYIGSGITQRTSANLTGSLQTSTYDVTAPAGYYNSNGTFSIPRRSGNDLTTSVSNGYLHLTYDQGYYPGGGKNLVPAMTSTDLTASGATVTVPAGYYSAQASKAIETGSITAPTITVDNETGEISASVRINTAGYLALNTTKSSTTQLDTQEDITITPTTSPQIAVTAGKYTTGTVVVAAIPSGTEGTPTATKGSVSNHAVTVTPSVTNSAGYIEGGTKTGTAVTVAASELVSGTLSITTSGTHDVTNYASINAASGSVSPTATKGAVSSNHSVAIYPYADTTQGFIGSGRSSGSAITISASELVSGTYTVDSSGTKDITNYASISVPSGSTTAPASITGTAATISTGTNTLTLTKSVSVTPSVTAGYISSGTAGDSSISLTASIPTKAAATITPSTTNQTIAADTYLTGVQTIAGDTDLVASNIISTANIFGVQGSVVVQNYYTGSSEPSSSLGQNGDIYIQQ